METRVFDSVNLHVMTHNFSFKFSTVLYKKRTDFVHEKDTVM